MMVYDIEFYAYLPKIQIYFFLHFDFRSDLESIRNILPAEPDPDPWKKMSDPQSSSLGQTAPFLVGQGCHTLYIDKHELTVQTVYDLSGIICHHGTAGGGHYTSYCCNPENGNWYHFDDSTVTQVLLLLLFTVGDTSC